MSNSQNLKKRQPKATQQQIDFMVDYFVQHPHVATGKFNSLHGRAELTGSWEQLAEQLNAMGRDGKMKDVKSWKSTWRDNKTSVSHKISKMRANRATTGNVGGPPLQLTEREKKIVGLMGYDYVEGLQSINSFPEEIPGAVELLRDGQEQILEAEPNALSVRENLNTGYIDYEVLDEQTEDQEGTNDITEAIATGGTEPAEEATEEPVQHATQRQPQIPRTRVRRAQGRERLSMQLANAREEFAELTDRQITCMEMFSKAMQKIAENDRERNEILRAFVARENARESVFVELTSILKECAEYMRPH